MSGSDVAITTQAYTVMIMPALASLTPKSPAMPVKRPMGMNSEVLKMNAAHVRPRSDSHSRAAMPSFAAPPAAVRAAMPPRPSSPTPRPVTARDCRRATRARARRGRPRPKRTQEAPGAAKPGSRAQARAGASRRKKAAPRLRMGPPVVTSRKTAAAADALPYASQAASAASLPLVRAQPLLAPEGELEPMTPPTNSPAAYRPSMTLPSASSTCRPSLITMPPMVVA